MKTLAERLRWWALGRATDESWNSYVDDLQEAAMRLTALEGQLRWLKVMAKSRCQDCHGTGRVCEVCACSGAASHAGDASHRWGDCRACAEIDSPPNSEPKQT